VRQAAEEDGDRDLLEQVGTLTEALGKLVERQPDREALVLLGRQKREKRVALRALWDQARAFQGTLVARGLQPGDSVVLILPTSPELISAYFGVLLAGGVPALLSTPSNRVADPRIFTGRVAHVVRTSKPHSIYCEPDVADLFGHDRAALLGRTQLLTPEEANVDVTLPEPVAREPEMIATMQYSSGSTGAPKAVLVNHRAVLSNLRAMKQAFEIRQDDVAVNWIPLYHDMGLFGAFLLPLLCGCRTVLIPTEDFMRDPALWLRAFQRYRGTFGWAPNLAYAICAKRLSDEDLEGLDLSSWRLALNGSEPVLARTVEAFARRMKPLGFRPEAMSPAYGLAETVVLATVQPVREEPRCEVLDRNALVAHELARVTTGDGVSCVSIGRCIPGCEMQIRDAGGHPLPERRVGKIWLRSDALFTRYDADPERTKQVLQDGWLETGDRGYMVDGYIFFVARDKDLIIIGGEKYVPDDIESAINRVSGVREGCVVVFGMLNEERGTEELAAVVETRENTPEGLEKLRRAIRSEVNRTTGLGLPHLLLTPPGGVEKTTSGKLARSSTRRRHLAALEGQ
jgi:acyl-CoA synthetase (AMP-forming)/AMP-acid ligase II